MTLVFESQRARSSIDTYRLSSSLLPSCPIDRRPPSRQSHTSSFRSPLLEHGSIPKSKSQRLLLYRILLLKLSNKAVLPACVPRTIESRNTSFPLTLTYPVR